MVEQEQSRVRQFVQEALQKPFREGETVGDLAMRPLEKKLPWLERHQGVKTALWLAIGTAFAGGCAYSYVVIQMLANH